MGCDLYWYLPSQKHHLPRALYRAMEKRYDFPVSVSIADTEYLFGLRDAGVEGAQELIDLIEKHDIVQLTREC